MTRDEKRRLHMAAAARNLWLERRKAGGGRTYWDAYDTRNGVLAARGLRRSELEQYLGIQPECADCGSTPVNVNGYPFCPVCDRCPCEACES